MATRVKESLRREIVPRHEIQAQDGAPISCPRCHRHNLTLYGNLQLSHVETWIEDETSAEGYRVIDEETFDKDSVIHEIESIACRDCRILFEIQTEENFELSRTNLELSRRLLEISGEDPLGMGRPC